MVWRAAEFKLYRVFQIWAASHQLVVTLSQNPSSEQDRRTADLFLTRPLKTLSRRAMASRLLGKYMMKKILNRDL